MQNHHVIIGDGLTAAEFATSRQYSLGDSLTIIGPDVENFGRGVAYAKAPIDAPWRYAYLLNSPSRSVDAEFAQWMNGNWDRLVDIMSDRTPDWIRAAELYSRSGDIASLNAPREIYGDFVCAKTQSKLNELSQSGIKIQHLPTHAERIERSDLGLTVITADGHQINADSIDVATGGPANKQIAGVNGERSFHQLFGNEIRIAELLKDGGELICIGSSAAMLDCLRFYQSIQSESNLQFTAVSPRGALFEPLRPSANFKPTEFDLAGTFHSADEFLSAIKALHQSALDSGDSFYETRVGMRELFAKKSLNEFVPDIDEARKVSRPLFSQFEGGTRDSIDDFNRLMSTGNTRIVAGRAIKIENRTHMASVVYSDIRGKEQALSASVVVNCAGPGNENRFDPLTNHMLRERWISICEHSGGILVGDGAQTTVEAVRYLGPAVTSIGEKVEQVPLYDASRLRHAVQATNQ